ncbi:MAG: hypothetical protein ACKVOU_10320 [Cytophagales bacterium]
MENERIDYEPDLVDGKYLGAISSDFVKIADQIKEASYQIRERKISQFPIFPVSKVEIAIGKLLYGKFEFGTDWNYYASMVEEFIQRKLVDSEMFEEFQSTYKNPDEYCCLFVVDEDFVNFVFIPYPEE